MARENSGPWWLSAGCKALSPDEADKIFFPGSGGKPKKAEAFCSKALCPVREQCLRNAIENDLDGFWAGTTKAERTVMAKHFHIKPKSVLDIMPEEPKKRRVYRKVTAGPVTDTIDYLDTLTEPPNLTEFAAN